MGIDGLVEQAHRHRPPSDRAFVMDQPFPAGRGGQVPVRVVDGT
jgi:hypothetical protein